MDCYRYPSIMRPPLVPILTSAPIRRPLPRMAIFGMVGIAALGGGLSGCAVHKVNLDPRPLVAATPTKEEPAADAPAWWSEWSMPQLDALIREALARNFDAAAAKERFEQALATLGRAKGANRPQLDFRGGLSRDIEADSRDLRDDQWSAGLSATWELDVFRRLDSTRLARKADAASRQGALDTARLTVTVGVTEAYFGIVEQRSLLTLLQQQAKTASDLLRLVEQRYEQGVVSRLDVLQQQSQLADLRSQIPPAEATLGELYGQLATLLGRLPGEADFAGLASANQFPALPALPTVGDPSALLRLRPDLRSAQADLISADAETARALADRIPRLSLTLDGLKTYGRGGEIGTVIFGANLVQPLLDWGNRRSEWVRTKSLYRERLNTFTQTYIRAVWEVDSLLRTGAKQSELLARLEERKGLLQATLDQARSRYDSGLTDYLPVFTAVQQLYAIEQRLVREQRRLVSLRVSLHRALGGPLGPEPVASSPDSATTSTPSKTGGAGLIHGSRLKG